MSTRRKFLLESLTAGIGVLAKMQCGFGGEDIKTGVLTPDRVGRSSRGVGPRIKAVVRREDTVLRYGVNGDNWNMTWASDDRQYVSLCDGAGFADPPKEFHNSRMLSMSGGPYGAVFQDIAAYPKLARPTQHANDTRYYNFGTLAVDGRLYQFLSTFNRSFRPEEMDSPNLNDVVRFNGAKLIYSPDCGRTWHNQDGSTPVVWEAWDRRSLETMAFFNEDQEAFSLLAMLQMGRNYEANRDGYVYVYAPNGNGEGSMNELVMFRVPKERLLNRQSYEYYGGANGAGQVKWVKDIEARAVVHTFPRGWVNKLAHPYAWHPSVVYNVPLGVYMMANWGMGTAGEGNWFAKPSYLGLWIARHPWGPWIQIHEETAWLPENDLRARAYEPQIAPKWISSDGKSFWLVWTDFQGFDSRDMRQSNEDYLKQRKDPNTENESDVMHSTANMRRYMPYYAFNAQRVDLII